MDEYEPIHQQVWDKLDGMAREIHQLKRANTALKKKLRRERRQNEKLRKEVRPEKQHYRNKQKHGRTFNG